VFGLWDVPTFYYVIIHVRNFESHIQLVDKCAPVKVASSTENLVIWTLHTPRWDRHMTFLT
jgi:hypothetical protein